MPDTVLFAPVGAKPCPLETSQNLRVNVSVYFHKKNNTVATLVRHMYAPKFGFITPEHVWSLLYKNLKPVTTNEKINFLHCTTIPGNSRISNKRKKIILNFPMGNQSFILKFPTNHERFILTFPMNKKKKSSGVPYGFPLNKNDHTEFKHLLFL